VTSLSSFVILTIVILFALFLPHVMRSHYVFSFVGCYLKCFVLCACAVSAIGLIGVVSTLMINIIVVIIVT
jgi:hypothetical protein